MRKLILIFLFSTLFVRTNGQQHHQERTLFIYNTFFGGITSGMGAVINKPGNENWKRSFLRGFWQGATGGLLNYWSKKTLHLINKNGNTVYGLPAVLLHAAGTSIMENAALNEPFLQNWNIDYGPVRFDFSVNGRKKFRARFLPVSIYGVIKAGRNSTPDLRTTLFTGQLSFKTKTPYVQLPRGYFGGASFGRAIAYAPLSDAFTMYVIPHELVHQFQYREYQIFNTWLKPLASKIRSKKFTNLFHNYIYPDIPYFLGAYTIEGWRHASSYFRNFYEFEAERFAVGSYVPVD